MAPYAALKKAITTARTTPQPRRTVIIPRKSPRTQDRPLETTTLLAVIPTTKPSSLLHVRIIAQRPRPSQRTLCLQSRVALAGLKGIRRSVLTTRTL